MTRVNVPLVTLEVPVGGREWQVTAVQNQDALLDASEDFEHFPFGLLLWESAVGLARRLAAQPDLVAGRRVLELGAGVGFAGMVAQALGAEVWQTDHQAQALVLARENAEKNGVSSIRQFLADWRTWDHAAKYDVILGADILYDRPMHFFLETIFRRNLTPDGLLLLSDPGRPQALECMARLETAGWQISLEMQTVRLEGAGWENQPVGVALLHCRLP